MPICGDTVAEGNETLLVNLGTPTNATLLDGQGIGTIADDEGAAGLSISDATVAEGDAGTATLTFTVTLAPPSAQQVTVPFSTANQTAASGAACAAGVDYVTTAGTLTFVPGDTSETLMVTVCPDTVVEGSETLLVNLGTPTGGAVLGDGQGLGTITDDDQAGGVSFSSATASVPESVGSVTITVQRSGGTGPSATANNASVPGGSVRPNPPASQAAPGGGAVSPNALTPASVSFATADQTATAGQDYVATAGTLNFGVNETTKTITIPILQDNLQEGSESFLVTLSNPTGGATLGAQATIAVVIVDTSHGASPDRPATTVPTTSGRSASARPRRSDGSVSAPTGATGTTTPSKATCWRRTATTRGRTSSSPIGTARSRSGSSRRPRRPAPRFTAVTTSKPTARSSTSSSSTPTRSRSSAGARGAHWNTGGGTHVAVNGPGPIFWNLGCVGGFP